MNEEQYIKIIKCKIDQQKWCCQKEYFRLNKINRQIEKIKTYVSFLNENLKEWINWFERVSFYLYIHCAVA